MTQYWNMPDETRNVFTEDGYFKSGDIGLMDENGYVRITDLGIARIWTPENSQDTSGTPGYMGNNHHLLTNI